MESDIAEVGVESTPLTEDMVREIFSRYGALRDGHFLLSSGLHSGVYFQAQTVLAYPDLAERLCRSLAERFRTERVTSVVGPAVGAIVIAHEVARALHVRALFSEREGGRMELRRAQALRAGERVLLVENVVTTGGSVNELRELVERSGATPVGVAALVDRTAKGAVPFPGLRFERLFRIEADAVEPARCPLCLVQKPLEAPGSRHLKS